jgi:hypothetical protein
MTTQTGRGEIRVAHGSTEEVWQLPVDEATLLELFRDCFQEWEHLTFGPLIEGAAWEIRPPREPRIGMYDGYATVNFEDWHFHICIGPHKQASEELQRIRPTAKAELYRGLHDGAGNMWAIRLFNGAGEQQITFLLPSPFLSDDQRNLPEPDWSRLALWDRVRKKYLGLEPDPIDRAGKGFTHGSPPAKASAPESAE